MSAYNRPTMSRSERRWRSLCFFVLFPCLGGGDLVTYF